MLLVELIIARHIYIDLLLQLQTFFQNVYRSGVRVSIGKWGGGALPGIGSFGSQIKANHSSGSISHTTDTGCFTNTNQQSSFSLPLSFLPKACVSVFFFYLYLRARARVCVWWAVFFLKTYLPYSDCEILSVSRARHLGIAFNCG